MASVTCPKCDILLKKGSWELFDKCPDCGTPWEVKPGEEQRIVRRVKITGAVFAALCVIPYIGVVSGLLGVFWGAMAYRFQRKVWGGVVIAVSVIVGLAVQPVLVYLHMRHLSEVYCEYELGIMSRSIQAFRDKNHRYPETLDELKKAKFEVPKQCFSGSGYYYLPPYGWRVTSVSSTMPAATQVGYSAKDGSRMVDAAEGSMPVSWKTKLPANTARVFAAASMPATFPATAPANAETTDLSKTLVVAEIATVDKWFWQSKWKETVPHQGKRTCIMGDMSVRSIGPQEFQQLLSLPQNQVFARAVKGAETVSTQPAPKKKAKTPPSE